MERRKVVANRGHPKSRLWKGFSQVASHKKERPGGKKGPMGKKSRYVRKAEGWEVLMSGTGWQVEGADRETDWWLGRADRCEQLIMWEGLIGWRCWYVGRIGERGESESWEGLMSRKGSRKGRADRWARLKVMKSWWVVKICKSVLPFTLAKLPVWEEPISTGGAN